MKKSTIAEKKLRDICAKQRALGFTQGDIAKRIGVTNGHLSILIHGVRKPSIRTALRIESIFSIPPREWFIIRTLGEPKRHDSGKQDVV
jgi:transcriptional regulator with XRE-family HTH domain